MRDAGIATPPARRGRLELLVRAYLLARRVLERLESAGRLLGLHVRARLNGTTLIIGRHVRAWNPVVVNGRGRVEIGDNVTLGFRLATGHRLPILLQAREADAVVEIGPGVVLVNGVEIIARKSVKIGAGTLVGPRCGIFDSDFHELHPDRRNKPGSTEPVVIGSRCWLGYEALVLKGVVIGEGAVVGARAVVSRDVKNGGIAVGPRAAELAQDVYGRALL